MLLQGGFASGLAQPPPQGRACLEPKKRFAKFRETSGGVEQTVHAILDETGQLTDLLVTTGSPAAMYS